MHNASPFPTRRAALRGLAASAAAALGPRAARADSFPSRPVTLIVGYPAGGPVDRHLRLLAELAAPHLGQSIVVENRPGAAGTLGPSQMAATARPDGYTLAQYGTGMLRVPHLQKVPWHPLHDFSFIMGLGQFNSGFVVRADSPLKSAADLLRVARTQPVSYGTAGIGSGAHALVQQLATSAQLQLEHVPYKGNPDLMQALLGGHIMAASDAGGFESLVDDGRLRLLFTFGARPGRRYPQVPTLKSLGHDVVGELPYGLAAPRDLDPAIARQLHDAFRRASSDARVLALLEQMNIEPWLRSGDEFRAWAAAAYDRERVQLERLGLLPQR